MEALLRGCETWTFGQEHFAELRTTCHKILLHIVSFQRRQGTDHLMFYTKALKKVQMRERRAYHLRKASTLCKGCTTDE